MDTIVLLITLSAGALAIRYKDRLWTVAGPRLRVATVLHDRAHGLSRLRLPEGWRAATDLNETASIEAIHALHGRHVIVISDSVEDFTPEMTMFEHSLNTRNELTIGIRVIACSGPERRTVAGFESLQYEIEGFYQQTRVKYLHTTIAGRRAFHQVLAWSTYSRYDRGAFETLLNGFEELPDSREARTLPQPPPVHATVESRYEVH